MVVDIAEQFQNREIRSSESKGVNIMGNVATRRDLIRHRFVFMFLVTWEIIFVLHWAKQVIGKKIKIL